MVAMAAARFSADEPLNDSGCRQAAVGFEIKSGTRQLTAPERRARQTAQLLGMRPVTEPRLADLDGDHLVSIIRRHGADRVIFGSDWPMTDPAAEVATIRSLGLTDDEVQAILGGNLARILNLKGSR